MILIPQPPVFAGLSGYVAELASAILGSELGLPVDHLDDHAGYISHWLRILKADPKALLSIASKADEAANYLFKLGGHDPVPDDADEFEAGANDGGAEHLHVGFAA